VTEISSDRPSVAPFQVDEMQDCLQSRSGVTEKWYAEDYFALQWLTILYRCGHQLRLLLQYTNVLVEKACMVRASRL
jgi:hypothetical protein